VERHFRTIVVQGHVDAVVVEPSVVVAVVLVVATTVTSRNIDIVIKRSIGLTLTLTVSIPHAVYVAVYVCHAVSTLIGQHALQEPGVPGLQLIDVHRQARLGRGNRSGNSRGRGHRGSR
jgi:hypothetical protein